MVFVGQLLGGTESSGDPQLKRLSREVLSPSTSPTVRRQAHDAILRTLNGVVSQTADAEEYLVLDQKGIVRRVDDAGARGRLGGHEQYFVQACSGDHGRAADLRLAGSRAIRRSPSARRCSTRTARRSASSRPI